MNKQILKQIILLTLLIIIIPTSIGGIFSDTPDIIVLPSRIGNQDLNISPFDLYVNNIFATGNLTIQGNIINVTTFNVNLTGNMTATGTITSNFFSGNNSQWNRSGDNVYTARENDMIGIGTNTPPNKLTLATSGGDGLMISNAQQNSSLIWAGNPTGSDSWMRLYYDYSLSDLVFQKSNDGSTWDENSILTLDWVNKNVGIGTNSPEYKFQVVESGGDTLLLADEGDGLVAIGYLGEELMTNGDCSSSTGWTVGSGWSITGGQCKKSSAGTGNLINTLVNIESGKTYFVSVDVPDTSFVFGIQMDAGGVTNILDGFYNDYRHHAIFTTSSTADFEMDSTVSGSRGNFDDFSLREVIQKPLVVTGDLSVGGISVGDAPLELTTTGLIGIIIQGTQQSSPRLEWRGGNANGDSIGSVNWDPSNSWFRWTGTGGGSFNLDTGAGILWGGSSPGILARYTNAGINLRARDSLFFHTGSGANPEGRISLSGGDTGSGFSGWDSIPVTMGGSEDVNLIFNGDFVIDTTYQNSRKTVMTGGLYVGSVDNLGSDLVSNGDFSAGGTNWNVPTGWSTGGGNANHNSNGVGALNQQITGLEVGQNYQVSWTLSDHTAGTVKVTWENARFIDYMRTSTATHFIGGSHQHIVRANSNTMNITFTPSNTARFKIDDVSIKRLGEGDLTAGNVTLHNLTIGNSTGIKLSDGENPTITIGGGDVTHTLNGVDYDGTIEVHQDGDTADPLGVAVHRHGNTSVIGGHFMMLRSRGTHDNQKILEDEDIIGRVSAFPFDGTDYSLGATIDFISDGGQGNDDSPTSISFSTSPDGNNVWVERMRIKPDGDIIIGGNLTFNNIYGEMHFHNDTVLNTTIIGSSDTWYNISALGNGQGYSGQFINGFDYTGGVTGILKTEIDGLYKTDYSISFEGSINNKYHFVVGVNSVPNLNTETHSRFGTGNDVVSASGTGLVQLSQGDNVTLMVLNSDAGNDLDVASVNINMVRVGG